MNLANGDVHGKRGNCLIKIRPLYLARGLRLLHRNLPAECSLTRISLLLSDNNRRFFIWWHSLSLYIYIAWITLTVKGRTFPIKIVKIRVKKEKKICCSFFENIKKKCRRKCFQKVLMISAIVTSMEELIANRFQCALLKFGSFYMII